MEGYVDPTEPLRDEGPFGDHIGPREVRSFKCEVRIVLASLRWFPFCIPHSSFALSRHHRRHSADGRLLHRRRGPHPTCGHPLPSDTHRMGEGWG
ncbi:MAG: hypothetical protein L0Z50_32670 [Verrucomicrobiales bacterium]|nr:hypothetical protein [Verrucomicrobiales bacterium]